MQPADDARFEELIESSREMAASAEAVQKLTRDAVIAENKSVRKRNTILLIGIGLLLISHAVQQARYYLVSQPQNTRIEDAIGKIEVNQDSLDEIVGFIDEVRSSNEEGNAEFEEELQMVFTAVFETREMLKCVLLSGTEDPASAVACAEKFGK